MQSKLESFDIEDLRNMARLNGLKRYSYKELLTDFLLVNLDPEVVRELITGHEEYQKDFREYLGYLSKQELLDQANERGIKVHSNMDKPQLIEAILGYRVNRKLRERRSSESLLDELNEPLATKTRKKESQKTKPKRTSPRRNTRSKKELRNFNVKELKSIAKERGLKGYSRLNKENLVNLLSKR